VGAFVSRYPLVITAGRFLRINRDDFAIKAIKITGVKSTQEVDIDYVEIDINDPETTYNYTKGIDNSNFYIYTKTHKMLIEFKHPDIGVDGIETIEAILKSRKMYNHFRDFCREGASKERNSGRYELSKSFRKIAKNKVNF